MKTTARNRAYFKRKRGDRELFGEFYAATTRPVAPVIPKNRFEFLSITRYKLDENKKPVPVEDIREWALWYETDERIVASTMIEGVHISTIFLSLATWNGKLFETMVFGGVHDDWMRRYDTWEEAEAGHKKAVEMVKLSMQ